MDRVTLLVTALTAGAVSGICESATEAAKDAYYKLESLLARWFAEHQSRELVLASREAKLDVWREPLVEAVAEPGAAMDRAIVEAAQCLMALMDEAGARAWKYTVDLRGAQGVQVGSHSQQTNTLTTPPQVP